MNTQIKSRKPNRFASIALGAAVVLWVGAVMSGAALTAGVSDRAAFILLLLLGMAMCGTAMKLETYGWANPFNLAGIAGGALILLLSLAVLFNLRLPFVPGDRAAFTILSALMAAKILLDLARGIAARFGQTARKLAAR